jgi:hypothetical protein
MALINGPFSMRLWSSVMAVRGRFAGRCLMCRRLVWGWEAPADRGVAKGEATLSRRDQPAAASGCEMRRREGEPLQFSCASL